MTFSTAHVTNRKDMPTITHNSLNGMRNYLLLPTKKTFKLYKFWEMIEMQENTLIVLILFRKLDNYIRKVSIDLPTITELIFENLKVII